MIIKYINRSLIATIALSALSAHAIIVSGLGDDYAAPTDNPNTVTAYSAFDWNGVYNINNSSGVAVGEHWILTAAHVANDVTDGNVKIGNTTYTGVSTYYQDDGADLALIYVANAIFTSYNITSSLSTSDTLLMVGYGNTGTVDTSTTFSDGGSGKGTKRWGTNKAIALSSVGTDENLDGTNEFTSQDFLMSFNTSDTTYEAGVGIGDSGGGVFVKNGDTWELAGIMNSSLSDGSTDYVGAVFLPTYSTWISDTMAMTTVIPEPTTIAIFGTGIFGLIGYRRRREWLKALQLRKRDKIITKSGERPLIESRVLSLPRVSERFQMAPQTAQNKDRIGDLIVKIVPVREAAPQTEPKMNRIGNLIMKMAPAREVAPQTAPKSDPIGDLVMKIDGFFVRR
jgi:V8-like Glu-specific endopeptidase